MGWFSGRSTELMTDGKIYSEIRETIASAKVRLFICSPYVDPTDDLIRQVESAARDREVDVSLYFREDKLAEYRGTVWFKRFHDAGIELMVVDRLHSKIYVNEKSALVTSMNFTRSSGENSLETGVVFDSSAGDLADQLFGYYEFLEGQSKPANGGRSTKPRTGWRRPTSPEPKRTCASDSSHCIGCGTSIPSQKDRPFCRSCYSSSDKHKTSPQKHCFGCGKATKVSFERPFCPECFRSQG